MVNGAPGGMLESKYCSGCGTIIHKSAGFCPNCGASQGYAPPPPHARSYPPHAPGSSYGPNHRSKVTAGILALLLGGLGVHRFYLGQAIGILYLLFCWTFIPSIIALIEGILFLTMSDRDWDIRYNGAPY